MGAFNILKYDTKCSKCHKSVRLRIQFKYGEVWDYEYSLGEKIIWNKNNAGEPGATNVVVEGISEECPYCHETTDYLIYLKKDFLDSVELDNKKYDFSKSKGYYLVLKK